MLINLVEAYPTATKYQYENWLYHATGEEFHPDYISKKLNDLKLTVKRICYEKKAKFSEENIAYYYDWIDTFRKTDINRLIFCDQSGFNRFNFHKKRGRSKKGERLFCGEQTPQGRDENVHFLVG